MPPKTKELVQTHLRPQLAKKLDALARAAGNTRAGYLRHLIEMHVDAINPRLLRALARTMPNIMPREKS